MTPGASPPADDNFVAVCPSCGKRIIVDRADEGKSLTCPYCNRTITVGPSHDAGILHYASGPPPQQQPSGDNSAMGWIIFILIFGVGNVILYATTGIFLIPIPRR